MMTSVKYSRIPMAEDEEKVSAFDYSSMFSYDNRCDTNWKYRSVFTYDNKALQLDLEKKTGPQLATDNLARLLVLFGFYVVYIITFPILVWFSFKKVKDNERFVVFRLGRCQGSKGPGIVFMLPMLDRYHKIDVHLRAFSVPPKQIITSDGAIIEVGAEIYHQVTDAEKSVKNVQNLNQSTRVLVQTGLCNILSQKTLAEIEAERRIIADVLLENSNKMCESWGVEIQRADLSQIKVLSEPTPKRAPQLMMPPGMFGGGAGGMGGDDPSGLAQAFMQLTKAVISNEGRGEGITEALMAFQKVQKEGSVTDEATEKTGEEVDPPQADHQETKSSPPQPPPPVESDQLEALIQSSLDESLVQKVGATFQFHIEGEEGGLYFLDLLNGQGSIGRGTLPSGDPDVSINTSMEDFRIMLRGGLSPFHAYMSGRLQVAGDVRVALRLEELMGRLKPRLSGEC